MNVSPTFLTGAKSVAASAASQRTFCSASVLPGCGESLVSRRQVNFFGDAKSRALTVSGRSIYSVLAKVVANRLKGDIGGFNRAHAIVARQHGELCEAAYGNLDSALKFGPLVNHVANRNGLQPTRATEHAAQTVAALCQRFVPEMATAPAAAQWDCLWRAASALGVATVPYRICNRAPEGVSTTDWNKANRLAAGVLAQLNDEAAVLADRGEKLLHASAAQIRGVFKQGVDQLMRPAIDPKRPGNLTREAAFDWLKENEPVLWVLAMLSFEP